MPASSTYTPRAFERTPPLGQLSVSSPEGDDEQQQAKRNGEQQPQR